MDVFAGGGEAGRDLARVDWRATPIGVPAAWPNALCTAVRIMLTSRFSMWMAWGPELTFFCNDAYRRDTLGAKYPWALGRSAREVWEEIWDDIGPRIDSVLRTGVATWDDTLMLFLERSGYREETYHTFSYSPLFDESGTPAGMLCVVAEETERALGERRLATLRDLSSGLAVADTEQRVFDTVEAVLGHHDRDLPFSAVYVIGNDDPRPYLVATTYRPDDLGGARWLPWPLEPLVEGESLVVELQGSDHGFDIPRGAWDRPVDHAVLLPLRTTRERRTTGVFVGGFNPYRPVDDTAIGFARLVAGYIASALGTARAFEEERQRRQALEDLDRVKTQFFANVSHEFRTPLTLIMGPLTELRVAVADLGAPALARDVEIIQRNGSRLSKLVNTLLDFSRLQAGRANAAFQPVALDEFTVELAEAFRVAIEHAGLRLKVVAPPVDESVFVDPDMWEKVVLNLLSNALKFTFIGEIGVSVSLENARAVLRVTDTGVGIPEEELPHVFERFHRIPSSRSRSVEGSGIGLALVSEIVALHGGTVGVTSTPDVGTTFEVTIPLGHDHLPPHQVATTATVPGPSGAEPFLAETRAWLTGFDDDRREGAWDDVDGGSDGSAPRTGSETAGPQSGEVLVADDNPDMRAYVKRVLEPEFSVRTVANGAEALDALRESSVDLVLSDLMMPELDGFELVRRIRADAALAEVPVILLTAHAGSAAELHGLNLGADDFLVKPFEATELRGRVAARLTAGVERRQRQALSDLERRLLDDRTPQEIVTTMQPFVEQWLGAANTALALVDDDGGLVRLFRHPAYGQGLDEKYHTGNPETPAPIFTPLASGERVILENADAVAHGYPDAFDDYLLGGREATLCVPLTRATGEINGSLASVWTGPRTFSPAELSFYERAAAAVTDALERLRVAQREHRMFVTFQEQLLEIDHRTPVAVVGARYEAASETLMVGGDWYDVVTLPDSSLGLSIGDAVGKGLPAARVMAQLRSAVGAAATWSDGPASVIGMVDRYAEHLPGALGTTLAYLDVAVDGSVTWASAGHPRPLIVSNGQVDIVDGHAQPPLGAAPERVPRQFDLRVDGPATVLLYTDGLVERRGESLTDGFERLCAVARANAELPVRWFVDAVVAGMRPAGGYGDDVAVLGVRLRGADSRRFVDAFPAIASEIPTARRRLRAWLEARGLADDDLHDVLLAVGEATTNAFEHGSRRDPHCVVGCEVSLIGEELTAAVTDCGTWDGDSTRSRGSDRGRGLGMIERLVDRVEIDRGRLGTCVILRRKVTT
jgi:signal transduction histidine kinase/CheY-like chemotaxis protein